MQATGRAGWQRFRHWFPIRSIPKVALLLMASAECSARLVVAQDAIPPANGSAKIPSLSTPTSVKSARGDSDTEGGLIQLDVSVTDRAGEPVAGLGVHDFTVLDQGEPAKIVSFRSFDGDSATSAPQTRVILVLDELNLAPGLVPEARQQIERFLLKNGGHLAQPTSVLTLTRDGLLWIEAAPSTDGNALAAILARNRKAGASDSYVEFPNGLRGSKIVPQPPDQFPAFRSSGLRALQVLGDLAASERQKAGRKIVIWIGPGAGIGSGAYFDRARNQAQLFSLVVWFSNLLREAHVALYSLSVGHIDTQQNTYDDYLKAPREETKAAFGDLARDVLAVQSGGGVPEPHNNVADEIGSCVKAASSFYRVSFDPSQAKDPDEYHELSVQLSRPGLTAKTTAGYYDEPFYSYQSDPATRRVTVLELEELLEKIHGKRDGEAARQLSQVRLTERLSSANLARLLGTLRGAKARSALQAVGDLSFFLEPPSSEIQPEGQPPAQEQQQIVALAREYLSNTIPNLPNFYARRTSARYLENSTYDDVNRTMNFRPLHLLDTSKDTVLYRRGEEVVGAQSEKRSAHTSETPDFTTYGTFGPALGLMSDLLGSLGEMQWSRWEERAGERRAVFRFRVPEARSRYRVEGCCLPEGDGTKGFGKQVAYSGEIAIDPKTGAVLRFEADAELENYLPFVRSDIVLLYGPVDIGGRTYICPLKSVSIWYARSVRILKEWNASFRAYGPYWTMMNDFEFDQFHIFRSSARILTGDQPLNDNK